MRLKPEKFFIVSLKILESPVPDRIDLKALGVPPKEPEIKVEEPLPKTKDN